MNVDRTRDLERFNENEDDIRFRKKEKAPETASVQDEHQPTVVSSADGAKVLKSIDDAIVEYEKEEKTKEKTFLGNLSKILNVSQHGSKSQYTTFEAMNGKVFTIRLANHNTNVSNFDNHEESEGFVVTHNEHNKIKDKNKDKSDIASKILAQNGYKVYLYSEKSTHKYEKRRDGRLNNDAMDIKTINNIGKYTLKSALESAASQKSKLCIVFENTKKAAKNLPPCSGECA